MHPILFSGIVFSQQFIIRSYTAFFAISGIWVFFGCLLLSVKNGFPIGKTILYLVLLGMSGIVGARILHSIVNFHTYAQNPALMVAATTGQFSVFGGILMTAFTGSIAGKWLHLPISRLADLWAPILAAGIAILRIGCFLNGCCFGSVTHGPFGVVFPYLSEPHKYQIVHGYTDILSVKPVHPTELYELLIAVFGGYIAFVIGRKYSDSGVAFPVFLFWYAGWRWLLYRFMVLPSTFSVPVTFYPVLYCMLMLCCVLFVFRKLQAAHNTVR